MTAEEEATLTRAVGRIEGKLDGVVAEVGGLRTDVSALKTQMAGSPCDEHARRITGLAKAVSENTATATRARASYSTVTVIASVAVALLSAVAWVITTFWRGQ